MKKIIIILLSLLLSGCNYIELNDMGIVTLIGISYKDNNYHILVEVKDNNKTEDEKASFYESESSSLEDALRKISLKEDKNLYYIDLNIVILDSITANNKLSYIIDYLTRDVMFSTNFNILIDDNYQDSINYIKDKNKIVGLYIKNIFDNQNNNIINDRYYSFLKNYLSEYNDIILPYGHLYNNEYYIDKAVIFNNKTITDYLDLNNIQSYNLINNLNKEYLYQIDYQDKNIVYKVSNYHTKLKVDNIIKIDISLKGSFIEIDDINLDDNKTIKELIILLNKKVKEDISNLFDKCLTNNSDILNIKKSYYNQNRLKLDNINNLKYQINTKIILDREGVIFNSIGDVYENNK